MLPLVGSSVGSVVEAVAVDCWSLSDFVGAVRSLRESLERSVPPSKSMCLGLGGGFFGNGGGGGWKGLGGGAVGFSAGLFGRVGGPEGFAGTVGPALEIDHDVDEP